MRKNAQKCAQITTDSTDLYGLIAQIYLAGAKMNAKGTWLAGWLLSDYCLLIIDYWGKRKRGKRFINCHQHFLLADGITTGDCPAYWSFESCANLDLANVMNC